MITPKFKATAIVLLIVANIAIFVGFRIRRAASLPPGMQQYVPLSELTPEEREKRIVSLFTLDSFRIEPVVAESGSVSIPRPTTWREQMINSISYVAEPVDKDSSKSADSKKADDSGPPWKAGATKINILSIDVSVHETESTPEANQILMREKT